MTTAPRVALATSPDGAGSAFNGMLRGAMIVFDGPEFQLWEMADSCPYADRCSLIRIDRKGQQFGNIFLLRTGQRRT